MKKYVRGNIDEDRLESIFKDVDDVLEKDGVGTTWDYDDLNVYLTLVTNYSEIFEYKIPIKDLMGDNTISNAADYILEYIEVDI